MVIQVHGQKGHIRRHVNNPEAIVELDAVVNVKVVIGKADMLHVQIAVTFLDHAGRHPPGEKVFMVAEKLLVEVNDPPIIRLVQTFTQVFFRLFKVFPDVEGNRFQGAEAAVVNHGRLTVEGRQHRRQPAQMIQTQLPGRQQVFHHPLLGELPHHHGIVHHRTGTAVVKTALPLDNRLHAQVNVPAQAAVQAHLFQAIVMPFFQGGIIDKTEVHRLFYFIDPLAGDNHPGDVGLEQLKVIRGSGITVRGQEVSNHRGQKGIRHQKLLDIQDRGGLIRYVSPRPAAFSSCPRIFTFRPSMRSRPSQNRRTASG